MNIPLKRRCHVTIIIISLLYKYHHVFGMSQKRYLSSLSPRIAPILGESALVDAETGQVYWQDTSRFRNTVEHAYWSERTGISRHLKCTFLSFILWLALLKTIVNTLVCAKLHTAIYVKPATSLGFSHPKYYWYLLLSLAIKTATLLPTVNKTVLGVVIILYLIESYTCSTKSYLENALRSPEEVKDYMENLRKQKPSVLWSVRCFHYEPQYLISARFWMMLGSKIWERLFGSDQILHTHKLGKNKFAEKRSLLTRIVESHRSTQAFDFSSWVDKTTAGIWRRAEITEHGKPLTFTKMRLSKVILLANSKTRNDYFTQQGRFVADHGRLDSHVEFSTSIHIPDFKPKLLAVRSTKGVLDRLFTIQMFWFLTFSGLTLPFRVWFAHRCDELHIMVVKETSGSDDWISLRNNVFGTTDETETYFQSRMEEAQLYN